jgi:hypothetical protein
MVCGNGKRLGHIPLASVADHPRSHLSGQMSLVRAPGKREGRPQLRSGLPKRIGCERTTTGMRLTDPARETIRAIT